MENIQRFIRYAQIDTQSNDATGKTPSTEKQKNLSRLLVQELKELGLEDAMMDEFGVVYAHLQGKGDKVGFNAHVDTALEVTDENCSPRIIKRFDGNDIHLNDEYVLSTKQFPSLTKHIGQDLVITDGNTLLGADDKAGIAIIMSALAYFHDNPEVEHRYISIAFTPDEEIGEGAAHFDLKKMNADYAVTIDGSYIDCIDYENFNAQSVKVFVRGVAVHPGEGKNALINAILILNELINGLPQDETPFDAGENDGYWHINNLNGTSESAELEMIIRDFDKQKLLQRGELIKKIAEKLQQKYPKITISVTIKDQYENMKPYVERDARAVDLARSALLKNGITPRSTKIRGGTDGATFSKMGLVTPNLGTGSYNHHGRYEYLVIQEFEKMIDVVIDMMKI
ncbi:MAG: peptidase T [Erysipelotrichaceae bacterium]|nr:peptidase T [Erysipelotrichaceae bacterium]